jgi:hypothetical protein
MLHKMEDPTPGSSEDPSMEQKNQFKNKITPSLRRQETTVENMASKYT